MYPFDIKDLSTLTVKHGIGPLSRPSLVPVVLPVLITFTFFCLINSLTVTIGNAGIPAKQRKIVNYI